MKKVLLFALLACAAVAAKAQTNYSLYIDGFPYNYSAAFSGKIAITFTSQYGEFALVSGNSVNASEYTGYRIVVSEASNMQFKFTYGGADHYPSVSVGENTGTFSSNLTAFELQGKAAGAHVVVDSAYLIKADGTEEEMIYGGDQWGCNYDVYEPAAITYTGQYGGNYVNDPETNEPFTYTYGSGERHTFTVTLANELEQNLFIELDENGEGYAWINLEAGQSEYTFVIDDAACTKYDKETGEATGHGDAVEYLYIKCDEEDDSNAYPFTVNFKSIVDVVSDATVDENNNDENVEEQTGGDENVDEQTGEEGNDENVDENNNDENVDENTDGNEEGNDENVDEQTGGENVDENTGGEEGNDEEVGGDENNNGENVDENTGGENVDENTGGENVDENTGGNEEGNDEEVGGGDNTDEQTGEETGIDSVSATATDSVFYNLAGQRVNGSANGLLIVDGKKVLVK